VSAKNYRIVKDLNLLRVEWEGGGQIPECLKGAFTSKAKIESTVAEYEKTKKPSRQAKRLVKDASSEDDN